MRKILQISILVLMVGVAAAYWMNAKPTQDLDWDLVNKQASTVASEKAEDDAWKGRAAPEFTLSNAQKKNFTLSQFKGQTVLVHFWATWCPPCVDELPHLLRFAQWAREKLGVVVLAVSVDEDWNKVRAFLGNEKIWGNRKAPIEVLLDATKEVAEKYKVDKYPETFLIGKNSTIIRKFTGAQKWDSEEMKKWLEQNI